MHSYVASNGACFMVTWTIFNYYLLDVGLIILFKAITVFYGIDNIQQRILHISTECGEYFVEYCQSRITLL